MHPPAGLFPSAFRHGLALVFVAFLTAMADARPRLLITTDIGGDPDDQQSLVRLMVYANAFRLEGLIASAAGTPGELGRAVTRPDLIREIVAAYGLVRPQLIRHETGWPESETLLGMICSGNPHRGRQHIGDDHDTAGSRRIIERVDAGNAGDPLNISIWGGQTDLAQALWRVRHDRGTGGLAAFVQRLRIFDIADQDGLAGWIGQEFPGLYYVLSVHQTGHDKRAAAFRGMYLGGDESLTSPAWIEQHVRSVSPLGALYPGRTWTAPNPHGCLKEGDTPSWFFFLPAGGNDPGDPSRPGWGGQYRRDADGWYRDLSVADGHDPRQSVSRWRPDYQADFARRMAWTRAPASITDSPVVAADPAKAKP